MSPTMNLLQAFRFAARALARDRGLTIPAVAALALGIAATTAIFTLVNGILLRPLPFEDPDRVVTISVRDIRNGETTTSGVSFPDLEDWRASARVFEQFGAFRETSMNVSEDDLAPERFGGAYVTANTFALLGHAPASGRTFTQEDDTPGAERVVVLSHTLWTTRYGARADMVGRTIRVNGVLTTVIGIMPEGFGFPQQTRLWLPLSALPATTLDDRVPRTLSAFARLEPSVTIEQASHRLHAVRTESAHIGDRPRAFE